MEDINIITTGKPDKTDKLLLIILVVVVIATLTLISVYLYKLYLAPKNTKTGVGTATGQATTGSNTTGQNSASATQNIRLVSYSVTLQSAAVGKDYQGVLQLAIYGFNTQLSGEVISGMPLGLRMTPCTTDYNNPTLTAKSKVNSLVRCGITGVPQESGKFTIQVRFTTKDVDGYFEKNFPLVVNP